MTEVESPIPETIEESEEPKSMEEVVAEEEITQQ